MNSFISTVIASTLMSSLVFILSSAVTRRVYLKSLKKTVSPGRDISERRDLVERLVSLIDVFDKRFPYKFSLEETSAVETRLIRAGRPLGLTAKQFISLKNLCGLGATCLSLASFSLFGVTAAPFFFITGYFTPELYIRALISRKRSLVERELPEAIEIISIMVTAGLNVSQAIRRASDNLSGPLGEELSAVVREIDLGIPRHRALQSLAERLTSDQVRRLVMAIRQAERYGTSLGDTLRLISEESREEQTRKLKEQAQKIPVKMLFPLVSMVLPAFLILTVGPLVLTMIK